MARITQIRFGLGGMVGGHLATGGPEPPAVTPGPGATLYLRNAVLEHVFGGNLLSQPANVYASLHSDYPDESGDNEVVGGSYARQAITLAVAAGGVKLTSAVIAWPNLPETFVTHVGVWDAASGGNMLFAEGLPVARFIPAGNTAEVASGNLKILLN